MVMGCTNKPWALDPAVQRRMPHTITVGLPGRDSRADILRVLLRKERCAPEGCDLGAVAEATEGYSGSDLRALVRAAAMDRMSGSNMASPLASRCRDSPPAPPAAARRHALSRGATARNR
jgi:transitional endoplasmic reticulum ATPase